MPPTPQILLISSPRPHRPHTSTTYLKPALGMFIIILYFGRVMGDRKTIVTVSLTTQAAEYLDFLAQKQTKGNRSRWVQTAILAAMAQDIVIEEKHICDEAWRKHGENGDKCNPNHRRGRCVVCWGDQ